MHRFSNNAESTLVEDLFAGDVVLSVAAGEGALFNVSVAGADPSVPWDGTYQVATLTHPDLPGIYEIVHLLLSMEDRFECGRAEEGTVAHTWPTGTKISANVTAGMLGSLVQRGFPGQPLDLLQQQGPIVLSDKVTPSASHAGDGFVANGVSRMTSTWVIGGHSVLQQAQSFDVHQERRAQAYESVGSSIPVDLGVPQVWTANHMYPCGSVVKHPVAPDFQFWPDFVSTANDTTVDSVTPDFQSYEYVYPDSGHPPTGAGPVQWRPVRMPVNERIQFPAGMLLVVTEVGFICSNYEGSAPPTVSIGSQDDPARFASFVVLDSLVGDGACSVHRIPVTSGGKAVGDLRFRVDVVSDGTCRGQFYWMGFFVQPSSNSFFGGVW